MPQWMGTGEKVPTDSGAGNYAIHHRRCRRGTSVTLIRGRASKAAAARWPGRQGSPTGALALCTRALQGLAALGISGLRKAAIFRLAPALRAPYPTKPVERAKSPRHRSSYHCSVTPSGFIGYLRWLLGATALNLAYYSSDQGSAGEGEKAVPC